MPRIPQEIIDQVLDRIDIVEIIGEYVSLKNAGRNFKACCPFHEEKTPSFVVSSDKQIYHCFGCGAGGNAIGFLMKYENMDFPEAIEKLSSRVGVELPKYERRDGEKVSVSSNIYKLNKIAAGFYWKYLNSDKGAAARKYINARNISKETVDEFKIGYAPDSWEAFTKYCVSRKIPPVLVKKAGLSITSDRGKGDYDRFRNRIIFPIFDERGNVLGFGGRVLDNSLPKYINSPETPVYSKSNVLYGLNFTRRYIREKGYAILVEGYMDVIIPFQYGVKNTVAASGTALTSRQVGLIKKYTDTAVIVFDSDQAGEAASLRGLDIMVENGITVRIVTLPEGEDPDTFIRAKGPEAFEDVIEKAKGLFEYKLDLLIEKKGIEDIGGICDEMLPTISKVTNAVLKSDYLKKLAERLSVHEASLRHELARIKPDYNSRTNVPVREEKELKLRNSEVHILGLSILNRKIAKRVNDELGPDEIKDPTVKMVMEALPEISGTSGYSDEIKPAKLLSRFEDNTQAKDMIITAISRAEIIQDPDKALDDCIISLRKENRDQEIKDLTVKLKKAQEDKNSPVMKELLTRINRIYKEKVV